MTPIAQLIILALRVGSRLTIIGQLRLNNYTPNHIMISSDEIILQRPPEYEGGRHV